jgi:hypothetical protein
MSFFLKAPINFDLCGTDLPCPECQARERGEGRGRPHLLQGTLFRTQATALPRLNVKESVDGELSSVFLSGWLPFEPRRVVGRKTRKLKEEVSN